MTANFKSLIFAAVVIISLPGSDRAAEWTQYRGPNHDGVSPEKILKVWPANGLRELWKTPLNGGFSSFAIGGGKAFTLVIRAVNGADQEVCVALDAASGKEIWAAPLGIAKYDHGGDSGAPDNKGGDGPRSTPSFDEGRVYTLSARLVLKCLDAENGRAIWTKDLVRENQGRVIMWENAASPMIDGDRIYVVGGGAGESLLAFDKKDGRVVWKGESDSMTHSTPVAATILGERQVIFFTQRGLVSVAAGTGKVLWRYPFRYSTSTAMTPVISGDMVYCSAGYGVGAGACKITRAGDGFEATRLWFEPASVLNNHWSTPVCQNGYLYGLFGFKEFARAPLKCVEVATGKVLWSKEGFGPGGCVLIDGHVLVLSDAGDLVLVKATPASYEEVARTHALSGKCWSAPALSDGHIFARSTKEGVCVDVSPRQVAGQ